MTESENKPKKALSAKGEKARQKLKHAAFEVLDEMGYHDIRIADVTQRAGVASGLFYHYFPDLLTLTREVLEDFTANAKQTQKIEQGITKGDWYGRIYAYNHLVVSSYSEHPGIMRCLLQLADADKEFSRMLRQGFIEQLSWLTHQMPRLFPDAGFDQAHGEHQSLLVVYSLSGMAQTLLRDYYINEEPELRHASLTDDAVAELLSVIFYRGLFLEHPPADRLHYTAQLSHMHR
ncbi:MAG: TetR/AcrR family transcriptional regulator [Pseudomonadota bacterium]